MNRIRDMSGMDYDWDEAKRIANIENHEIDFWDVRLFDWDTAEFYPSPRHGEMRWVAIGNLRERLHCVIYTERGALRRIISIRKANPREARRYAQS